MTNESNLKVVFAGWDELPGFAKWDLGEVYKIKPEEYRVYADMRKGKRMLYVHKDVPEKDVAGFVRIATCTCRGYREPDSETRQFIDYVCATYGDAAYYTLHNAQLKAAKEYRENLAREKVQAMLADIRAMIDADMCNDYMIAEAWNAGYDEGEKRKKDELDEANLYVYCMGYLEGLAAAGKAAGAAV